MFNLSSCLKFCLEVVKAKQQKVNEKNRMYLLWRTRALFIFLSSVEFCVHVKSCFRAIVESTRCPLGSHDLGTQSPGLCQQARPTVGLCWPQLLNWDQGPSGGLVPAFCSVNWGLLEVCSQHAVVWTGAFWRSAPSIPQCELLCNTTPCSPWMDWVLQNDELREGPPLSSCLCRIFGTVLQRSLILRGGVHPKWLTCPAQSQDSNTGNWGAETSA